MTTAQEPSQAIVDEFVGVCHGDLGRVKELADAHPSLLNANASWDETPLGAASQMGNREIIEFLLSRGVSLDIFAAAVLGMADRVSEFLRVDPSLAQARGAHGIPIMWYPAIGGHLPVAEILLHHGADVNAGAGGNTALHGAALFGRSEAVEWLLDHGADVNLKNYEDKTALALAIQRGHSDIADLLRRHGGVE